MEFDPVVNPEIKTLCALKAHYIIMGFMYTINALVEAGDIDGLNELGLLLKEFAERKLAETEFKIENV